MSSKRSSQRSSAGTAIIRLRGLPPRRSRAQYDTASGFRPDSRSRCVVRTLASLEPADFVGCVVRTLASLEPADFVGCVVRTLASLEPADSQGPAGLLFALFRNDRPGRPGPARAPARRARPSPGDGAATTG